MATKPSEKIELEPLQVIPMRPRGVIQRARWPRGVFRFSRGQYVWVRDRRIARGGFRIVRARVNERHYHPGRHPGYPNGEGYSLAGELYWDCYPGSRVFATREEAIAARIGEMRKASQ
ncbi:MAG: hypothetical protein KGL39_57035 [Patescibacteria group bacterium]|nr:hypothetical protein [Patescibacteria group bacterium]